MKHAIWGLVLLAAGAGRSAAADLPCGPAERGTVQLDGILDDWQEVEGIDVGGRDPNLSFTLKCNLEPGALLLLVDVRDNYFVRTKQARPGEDHITLTLSGKPLIIYPGDASAIPTRVTWGAATPANRVRAFSALQDKGYAVELQLPLGAVPGYRAGMPLPFKAEVADCDSKAQLKVERSLDTQGSIVFAEGDNALESFLKDRGLKRGDVYFDRGVALGGKSGARLLLAAGKDKQYLAALSDGFTYIELPYRTRADLKEARIFDLAGDGRQALVLRYVERGGQGVREVLGIWRVVSESQIERVFAAEVGKSAGANRIDDKVSFIKRGRATDILIEAGAASGFSAANFKEEPASDMVPILLPWGDDRRARYQFSGDQYRRAQ
jgi:hypothetical protein